MLFSALLRNELRDVDLAGRFDGEKIAVLLPESDQAAAAVFAKRLRNKVAETSINVGDNQLLMTFNIGIAAILGNDTTGSQALMRANQALIQKKTAADTTQAAPQNSHQGARCNTKQSKMAPCANQSR